MRATTLDLVCPQEDDYELTLVMTDASDDPLDWSIFTFEAQVRPTPKSPIVEAFTVATSIVDGGTQILLTMAQDRTKLLPLDNRYDVVRIADDGKRVTILRGKFTADRNVTR